MNSEKHKPLIWDFAKLLVAVLITVFLVLDTICNTGHFEGLTLSLVTHGSDAVLVCIAMTQLPAVLAGWWGWQVIHNSNMAADKSKGIRACLIMNVTIGIFCSISMVAACTGTLLILMVFPGSLLFYVSILLTTITAFIIRGRFFLHLITVYFLLAAHLLFWYLAVEIAAAC